MNKELEKVRTKCCKAKITIKKYKEKDGIREVVIFLCSFCSKEISKSFSEPLFLK